MPIKEKSILAVKEKINAIDVIKEYVDLKKAGASWLGLCPFHDEKTPSFSVNSQHFHCFGCKEHGDVIHFLSRHKGLSFVEAVESLAEKAGVRLDRTEARQELPSIFSPLKDVDCLYQQRLRASSEGSAALEYLRQRGFAAEDLKQFGVGLVPAAEDFWTFYNAKNYTLSPKDCGVLVKLFEGRISFPIRDALGKTVGFSCRKWKSNCEEAKYINSCETAVFKKSSILYGLDISRKQIAKKECAILCEGQFDVIRVILSGFAFAVASLGTSFNEEQAKILKTTGAKKVYIAFDGDEAGKKATIKTGDILQRAGIEPLILSLPDGEDCDSFILKKGASNFEEVLNNPIGFIFFLGNYYLKRHGDTPNGKSRAYDDCVKIINGWNNPIVVNESILELKKALELSEAASVAAFNKVVLKIDNALWGEKMALCAILAFWGETVLLGCVEVSDFNNAVCQKLFSLLKNSQGKTRQEIVSILKAKGFSEIYSRLINFASPEKVKDTKKIVTNLRKEINHFKLKSLQKRLKYELAKGEDSSETIKEIKSLESLIVR